MKKHSTGSMTMGIDLGDRISHVAVVDDSGEVTERFRVTTTRTGFEDAFGERAAVRVVMEATTHSRWVSSLLGALGHEVVVANPRSLALIYKQQRKNDKRDAELLARVGRLDPQLLSPIQHRSDDAHADLSMVTTRDSLVRARTSLISCVRGMVKAFGERLPSCSADSFHHKAAPHIPQPLLPAVQSLLRSIAKLTEEIHLLDRKITQLSKTKYPDTALLQQVAGVGPITALTFVLTLESPQRVSQSRQVGAYLGLVPRQDQSGAVDKQLRITKAGNGYLRRLLVQCAHHILGRFGPDTDLQRWGNRLSERGGKNARKRAVVAVARKLAVLLHTLWSTGEQYVPVGYGKRPVAHAA
jgi:transposase